MTRHWLWLLALAALFTLPACSDDEDNPPSAEIVYPESGRHFSASPDSVVVAADDDNGVSSVEIRLDGEVVSTVRTEPYSTRLPLGLYADGQVHVLDATAKDSRGATADADPVTVTIDPALQTIPQIVELEADADDLAHLRLTWLAWPDAVTRYEWEIARDDAFENVAAAGNATEVTVPTAVAAVGLAYARVRVVAPGETTAWSRTARFSSITGWRRHYDLPGAQLGTAVLTAADGTLRVLSHAVARHRVSPAAVELLELDAELDLVASHELLPETYTPTSHLLTDDGRLLLAGSQDGGTAFVAAADLAGNLLWSGSVGFMGTAVLVLDTDGDPLIVGDDLRELQPGGVMATVGVDGAVVETGTFALDAGRSVLLAWPDGDGGHVLAGQMPATEDGIPGGVWALGLAADHAERWRVRLGTADRWRLFGGAADGNGRFVLTGMAFRDTDKNRYGFIAGLDVDGHLRWQLADNDWHYVAGVAADTGGRWTMTGVLERDEESDYDLALRNVTEAGEDRWEVRLASGPESQGWTLAPHPDGGWWVAGTRREEGQDHDVDLLRVDDRGALD